MISHSNALERKFDLDVKYTEGLKNAPPTYMLIYVEN